MAGKLFHTQHHLRYILYSKNNVYNLCIIDKHYTKQIDKAAVDKYELDKSEDDKSVEVFAPSCTILLQWTGKPGSEVTPLKAYRVMISGTTKPDTSFIIFHNPWLERKDEVGEKIKQDAVKRPVLVSCAYMYASAEVKPAFFIRMQAHLWWN